MDRSTAAVRLLAGDKEPVRFKTTGNHTLAGLASANTDDVTPVAGDRALVSEQDDATENGIYTASAGVWRRAPDSGSSRALVAGMKVHVQEGDAHAGEVWMLDTNHPNFGNDDISFSLFIDTKSRYAGLAPERFWLAIDADWTNAFQRLSDHLNAYGGSYVEFAKGASYAVWSAGMTPSYLFELDDVHGTEFKFNGAKFTTNNLFDPQGAAYAFVFRNCSGLRFIGAALEQTAYTTLDYLKGASLFGGGPGNSNIHFAGIKQKGGIGGIIFAAGPTDAPSHGITLDGADFENVYYPLNFQLCGNGFTATGVKTTNCGRPYFVAGSVYDHDVSITSNGSQSAHDQILIKQYAQASASPDRNKLRGITVRYSNTGQAAANNLPCLVCLEVQQTVPPMVITGAANNGSGKVRLTVNSSANAADGQTWNFATIVGTVEANVTTTIDVVDATHVDLPLINFVNAYVSGGYGNVPAGMEGIHIILDVDDVTGNGQPPAVITRSWTHDGLANTMNIEYLFDNIDISGKVGGYNFGVRAIDMFTNNANPGALGTWGGAKLRNIRLHDLTITGTNTNARFDATSVTSAQIENIVATPTTVTWTVTDPNGVVRVTNAPNVTGLTDHRAVVPSTAPANQFAVGVNAVTGNIAYAQPSASNLSDGTTGTSTVVRSNAPTLVAPVLGAATATSINKVAITAPATSATLTLIDGTTLTGPAASGTVMTLGNTESVSGQKTFSSLRVANNTFISALDTGGNTGSGFINDSTNMVKFAQGNNNEMRFSAGFSVSAANIFTWHTNSTSSAPKMRLSGPGGLFVGATATDAGAGNIQAEGGIIPGSFTVAGLPAGVTAKTVNCSNCRVFNGTGTQEGAGLGTGSLVTYNGSWKLPGTNVAAAA